MRQLVPEQAEVGARKKWQPINKKKAKCAFPGCITKLNMYNTERNSRSKYCLIHKFADEKQPSIMSANKIKERA